MIDTTNEPISSIDSLEAFWEFNRSIHQGIMSLDSLTRSDLFDAERLKALASEVVRARAAANVYLVAVIGSKEADLVASTPGRSSCPRTIDKSRT
jgi:hypothetical protein